MFGYYALEYYLDLMLSYWSLVNNLDRAIGSVVPLALDSTWLPLMFYLWSYNDAIAILFGGYCYYLDFRLIYDVGVSVLS